VPLGGTTENKKDVGRVARSDAPSNSRHAMVRLKSSAPKQLSYPILFGFKFNKDGYIE
jgi:hypothetical protein